ncbi:MAG: sulfatase-like hydrolase/transferase [Melioribacteraceae bacterium]|nr:sulfatase-like hydrolase/transferase [Melioribacteraceae bacterium]
MKKTTIIIAIFLTFYALILFTSCAGENKQAQPNIVFIFADDQAYNTVGAYGNHEIKTPNLDRLAERGTAFTHAFNMGAWGGAVCVASRAMLNTGRFVWNAHQYEDRQHELADEGKMWSQLMESAGYNTYMSGKWHVKTPADSIFQNTLHIRPGMPSHFWNKSVHQKYNDSVKTDLLNIEEIMPFGYNRPKNLADTSWQPWDKKNGGYWKGGKHWSEVLGDDAITFIDKASTKEDPFFMYLAFNAPHDPRQAPKEFVDMYPVEKIQVPSSFLPEYPEKDAIGCGRMLRDEALAPFPRTEYSIKKLRQEYYAIISHMDSQIGRIIDHLKKSDQLENTYIIFTADHGLAAGNHGLVGKQNMYDHSIRVPLFIVGPNVPENKKVEHDVYLQDVMASTLDIAGLQKPTYIEFNSLMPLISGQQTESNYTEIYGCYLKDKQRMIRKDNYKLIVYPESKTIKLFDLENDPNEITDLSADAQHQEKKKTLFYALVKLQKEMNDPLDLEKIMKL